MPGTLSVIRLGLNGAGKLAWRKAHGTALTRVAVTLVSDSPVTRPHGHAGAWCLHSVPAPLLTRLHTPLAPGHCPFKHVRGDQPDHLPRARRAARDLRRARPRQHRGALPDPGNDA